MRRRKNKPVTHPTRGFGLEPAQLQAAKDEIKTLEQRMSEVMITRDFQGMDVIEWMFPQDVIECMRSAFGKVRYDSNDPHYTIKALGSKWRARFSFNSFNMVAPSEDCLKLQFQHPKHAAISAAFNEIAVLKSRFEELKEVVEWLDDHATAAAIKYFFPAMEALIPQSDSAFHRANGINYHAEPQGIALRLPAIRNGASLIASAMLSPKPDSDIVPLITVQPPVGKYDWSPVIIRLV